MSEQPRVRTWNGSRAQWLETRFAPLVLHFERTLVPFEEAITLARGALAFQAIDSRWGQNEDNHNPGNLRRGSYQGDWFTRDGRQWRSYRTIDESAADTVHFWQSRRYAPATAILLRTGDPVAFYRRAIDNPTDGPGYHPADESSEREYLNAWTRIPLYARRTE